MKIILNNKILKIMDENNSLNNEILELMFNMKK